MQTRQLVEGGRAGPVDLRAQWEAFHTAGAIAGGVRPEIAASWRRCAQARPGPAAPVDAAALREFDHAPPSRQRFRRAAETVADGLVEELGDAAAAVVVCDDFGMVLHRAGRAQVLRVVDRVNLVPGALWSERLAGTTGIGLALVTGATAHVYAAEHSAETLHRFGCTATIIHQPVTGEALGVLGLATPASIPASLARPLVVRAAREIEHRLDDAVLGRERRLMEHHLRGRASGPGSLLTVDRAGHTVIQSARLLQEATGEDVALLLELAHQALRADRDLTEELELSRGRVRVDTELAREGEEILGAVVSLRRLAPHRRHGLAVGDPPDFAPLVGRSPAMGRLFRDAGRVARERTPVVIRGEPGTGKVALARRMHELGGGGPLTEIHCALPGWERELGRAGADRGTVVLRRAHALSPDGQLALCDHLDAIEESSATPWIIAVLNLHAPPPCPELLTRLARVTLTVPALRDREHDLRRLVEHWCDARGETTGRRPTVRADAHEALAARSWPGNVRELHNVLAAAALRGGTVIGVEALNLPAAPAALAPGEPATLRDLERAAIDAALRRCGGNVSRAARELGIGRATLHRRLRAYRLLDGPSTPS